ncbi:MAG: ComEC/Rec2 family competence protein [Ignavibacteria bacterium]|nr:ComEC/Rec2 family competence protein [Ignavibacteria bacterium]
MERRLPLVFPTLCVLGWVLILTVAHASESLLFWTSAVSITLAVISLKRGSLATAFHCSCLALGCITVQYRASHMVDTSDVFGPAMRVRAEGVVQEIKRSSPGKHRYVLMGEIDASELPCVRAACLVTEWVADSLRPPPRKGETRIVTGLLRRPDPATLPDEVPEKAVCHGFGASLIITNASSAVVRDQPWWNRWSDVTREWMVSIFERELPRDVSALAIAVVIGDRTALDPEVMQVYAASGTAHMFSVSGSHVGIILGVLITIIGSAPSWWRVVVISLIIAAYVFVSGGEPPAVRAGLMGIVALVARRRELHTDMVNILCGVALGMVLVDPTVSTQPGMILSVMTIASILIVGPLWFNGVMRLVDRPRPWKRALAATCATSIAATIGVSIPSLVYFSSTSLTAPFANLIVVPLLSCALVACLLLCITSVVGVTAPVAWCISVLVRMADHVAQGTADNSLAHVHDVWKWVIVVLMIATLLWPLVSPTFIGGVVRMVAGVVVIIGVIWCIPVRATETFIAQRRNGIVIAAVCRDTLNVFIDGQHHAAIDGKLMLWVKRQPIPVKCEGRGLWGRRMSATIRRELVGSKYEDHQSIQR